MLPEVVISKRIIEIEDLKLYEGVSKSFRTESITKYTLTFGITCWEAAQRVMAAKLTRLTHKIAAQLHLVAESCNICSSRSRRLGYTLVRQEAMWVYCKVSCVRVKTKGRPCPPDLC
jgi:hypothetical protein